MEHKYQVVRYNRSDGYNVYMYLEGSYCQSGLTAKEITRQRNSLRTKDVIGRMRSFLNVLTSEVHPPHTLLSTCRANGISTLAYLKKFFREVVEGRRDYENLLPMTI